MATKDYDLSLGDKSKSFNSSVSNHDNQQYRNLNLNGIHQSSNNDPISQSSKNNSFKNDERNFNDYNNTKAKNNFNSFNKSEKSPQNLLSLFSDAVKEEKENRWKKKKDNDAKKNKSNDSTLSLHISAYENSIEASAASAASNGDKKDGDKGLSKSMKNAKFSLTSSSSSTPKMPSPFEIPRQRENRKSKPEVMQFKASQKLFNPNSTHSSSNSGNNSMLNENSSLPGYTTRACLGRTAQIGDIYDVRTEQLLHGVNIFNGLLPEDIITVINNYNEDFVYNSSSKTSDKFTALNIEGELRASFLAGMIKGSGSAGYINEKVNTKEFIQYSWIQKIKTCVKKININDKRLKELIASNIGELHGTHVLVGFQMGANSVISMEYEQSNDELKKKIDGEFEIGFGKSVISVEGGASGSYDEKDNECTDRLNFKVHTDMKKTGLQRPRNLIEAKKYFNSVTQKCETENEEGVQLEWQLLPLSDVLKIFGIQDVYDRNICKIEKKTTERLAQLFDTVYESSAMLQNLVKFISDNEKYVAKEDKEAIRNYANEFDAAVSEMEGNLNALLKKVRSDEEETCEIDILRSEFLKNPFTSPSKAIEFVDSYKHLKEKLDFINDCEKRGILMVTNINQLAKIKRDHQDTETFMLYASYKNDVLLPQWTENINHFYTLQKQPGEKLLAVVDTDVLPNIAKNELLPDRIRVVEYFNGRYISDDCLERQKKMKSQCLVACDNMLPNFNKINMHAIPIDFQCPKSMGCGKCSKGNKVWTCPRCQQQPLYFERNLYCGCGYNTVEEFAFKCCDEMHGNDYIKPTKEALEYSIKCLKPLPVKKILVIGESGVGKSTFINSVMNLIGYDSIDDALKNGVINEIPTEFELTVNRTGRKTQKTVRVGTPNDNEDFTKGQSTTQKPKTYKFLLDNTIYKLIDCPGIGDTRGIEQDKKNMDYIMQYISKREEIHGICILMKPDEKNLSAHFEWCFKELLNQFHRTIVENIVFCFTKTSGCLFDVGKTLTPLEILLEKIEKDRHITIPLTDERMYSFENNFYEYLCAVEQENVEYTSDQKESYAKHFNISKESTLEMLKHMSTRKPHNVEDSCSIYRAKNIISQLTYPLTMINNAMAETLEKVKDKQKLIAKFHDDENELRKILIKKIPFIRWYIKVYNQYFCKTCSKLEYYHGDDRLQFLEADPTAMDKDPFTLCYPTHRLKCENERCPDCGPNTKVVCGTDWFYKKPDTREEENITVAGQIKESLKTREGIQEEVKKVEQLKKELIAENDAIVKAAARFAYFLDKNSLTTYNDATERYLKLLIEKEKKTRILLKQQRYEEMLSRYHAEKSMFEKQLKSASKFEDKSIKISDIMETVDSLKKLKHYGGDIAKAIDECNKAVLYEGTTEEMEVELPNQRQSSSLFKWLKKTVFGK